LLRNFACGAKLVAKQSVHEIPGVIVSADPTARELLGTAAAATRRTRRARQGYWFPLIVFGAVVAGASPFYVVDPPAAGVAVVAYQDRAPLLQGGGPLGGDGRAASLYWLIALPLGYAAVLLFYRLRARRAGVAGRAWPFLAAGLGLLAVLLATGPWVDLDVQAFHTNLTPQAPGDMSVRGLLPILIIALGLCVLARLERSRALTIFAVSYLVLVIVANLYDLENLLPYSWLGADGRYAAEPDLLIPAVVLLLGGMFFAVRSRQAR
jgi:hypothetical protein